MANIDDEYRSSDDEEYVPEDESGSESDEDGDKLANDECLDDEIRGVEKDLVSSAEIKNDKNTAIDGNTIDTLWREFIEESCSNPTTDQISEQKEDKIKSPKSDQKYTGTNGQAEVNEIRTKTGLKRKFPGSSPKKSGLAASIGTLLTKKSKSILDNSEEHWKKFVQDEELEDELSGHNKGKDSFIEKNKFLLRADHRQFEKEKELRQIDRKTKR